MKCRCILFGYVFWSNLNGSPKPVSSPSWLFGSCPGQEQCGYTLAKALNGWHQNLQESMEVWIRYFDLMIDEQNIWRLSLGNSSIARASGIPHSTRRFKRKMQWISEITTEGKTAPAAPGFHLKTKQTNRKTHKQKTQTIFALIMFRSLQWPLYSQQSSLGRWLLCRSLTKANAGSCPWGGTTSCISTALGPTCWRAALWRGTWVSWWTTGWPCASSVPWLPRRPMGSWGASRRVWPAGRGRFSFPSTLP